jgi:hypothetical protein
MTVLIPVFLLVSLVCFALAAFEVPAKVNLIAMGLFFFACSFLEKVWVAAK